MNSVTLTKQNLMTAMLGTVIIISSILVAPDAYARHLSDNQRYNDGFNDGTQTAITDRQNGNSFNPVCDPTSAHTSDGQHTTTYCSGWSNGYTSAWNGDSGPSSSSDNSGQGNILQNGNDGKGSIGGGNLLDKAEKFCINNVGLCSAIGHSLLSGLGLG